MGVSLVAASLLIGGCGGSRAIASTNQERVADSTPSLGTCVGRWNHASLGEGPEAARLAAYQGTSALMVRFPDGACGLVFPRGKVTPGEHDRASMVSFLDGNYTMSWSPLGMASASEMAKLQSDADKQTNVFVRKSNGSVFARWDAQIVAAPNITFLNEPECLHIIVPSYALTARYEVKRTSVACVVVRTLMWAWPSLEHAAEQADKPTRTMYIIGWRCVGADRIQSFTPVTYEKITCTHGGNVTEVQNLAKQAILSMSSAND
jgi:hypothetical protein